MKLRHLLAVARFPEAASVNRKHVLIPGIAAQAMTNEQRKAVNLPHEGERAMARRVRQRERAEAKRAKNTQIATARAPSGHQEEEDAKDA